jgi:hypothetical protein
MSKRLVHHRGTESTEVDGDFVVFLCVLCASVVKDGGGNRDARAVRTASLTHAPLASIRDQRHA